MHRRSLLTLAGIAAAGIAATLVFTAQAQQPPRKSPHETSTFVLGGKKITITYGRPYKKGREIFGGLEPLGKVWRTGADEATVLTTEGDLMLGPLHVVAGSYSLFTIPEKGKWTIILNKTVKQWGAFKYDQAQDYGRAEMKVTKAPSTVEQLTIDIEKKGAENGNLRILWDDTVASIPVMMH
ncbi:MAG: DUF2911 domain-containing protein [Bryobacterales bacterium]|nr:DUF2911 domain-containing protein [Bryobacterales bacterium]